MKAKSFVVAGLIAGALSPAFADVTDFKVTVDKDTGKVLMDEDSAALAVALKKLQDAEKLSADIQKAKQQCTSKNDFWYEGNCISKNPCTSKKEADKKYCVTAFKKVQVASEQDGANIVKAYVKNVLKWEGCAGGIKIPKSKAMGQDYITCQSPTGEPRVFEFDDLSESSNKLAVSNRAYGLCIAYKGKMTFPKSGADQVVCNGISKKICEDTLFGSFESNKCVVRM